MWTWYEEHLGIDAQDWGGAAAFDWTDADGKPIGGTAAWCIAGEDEDSFTAPFMINYLVAYLDALLKALQEEDCNVLDKVDDSEYGKFGWVINPEGNKIELWESPAGE